VNRKFDSIVIGAGVIGCAVAFEMTKKGYKTLNIEKQPAAGHGSTGNTCAIVRLHYSTIDGVKMAYEASKHWEDWENYLGTEDEMGFAKYINNGAILLKTKGHDWRRVLQHYKQLGIEFEEWDLPMLKEKMPIFHHGAFWPPKRPEDEGFWDEPTGEIGGAIYTPSSGQVNDPILSTHNLQRAAEAHGAEFLFNSEVVEIRHTAERVMGVTLNDDEKIDAAVVVNVAGPHSFIINHTAGVDAGMKIRTRALRHEVHHVPAPKGFDFEKRGCFTSDGDLDAYFRPEAGNMILVGSEDPECDPREWVEDPDNFSRSVTNAQWKAQVYRLAKRIPSLRIPNKRAGIVDLYDVSDDWIPIYDKSDLKGFYMAVGTSGNQYKNAPIAGYMMAEIIDACEKGTDHDRDPVRIRCRYTGLTLNAGFYSRLREVNTDSSFSVKG
jgi:sarcosine oxidase subunit beta